MEYQEDETVERNAMQVDVHRYCIAYSFFETIFRFLFSIIFFQLDFRNKRSRSNEKLDDENSNISNSNNATKKVSSMIRSVSKIGLTGVSSVIAAAAAASTIFRKKSRKEEASVVMDENQFPSSLSKDDAMQTSSEDTFSEKSSGENYEDGSKDGSETGSETGSEKDCEADSEEGFGDKVSNSANNMESNFQSLQETSVLTDVT